MACTWRLWRRPKPEERITLAEVKQHPWMTKHRKEDALQAALQRLALAKITSARLGEAALCCAWRPDVDVLQLVVSLLPRQPLAAAHQRQGNHLPPLETHKVTFAGNPQWWKAGAYSAPSFESLPAKIDWDKTPAVAASPNPATPASSRPIPIVGDIIQADRQNPLTTRTIIASFRALYGAQPRS